MQRRPAAPNARNSSRASDLPVDKQRLLALASKRFDVFTRMAFHVVEGKTLEFEPYVESLCFELQEMIEGRCSRLLINMPPRHLKSFTVAIALPAFALGHRPGLDIVVATYNQELGRDHTEAFLRLVASPFYRACFPGVRLSETRVENVRTEAGGGRRPVTVGGAFTGLGADILVLDDLIKVQDVEHGPLREEVLRFYRETAVTRLNDQRTQREGLC